MTQPLPELGRALLVKLEPGLKQWRLVGLSCNIMGLPGVTAVVDLAAVSAETLDVLLLPNEAKVPVRKRRKM